MKNNRILTYSQVWGLILIRDEEPASATEFHQLMEMDGFKKSFATCYSLLEWYKRNGLATSRHTLTTRGERAIEETIESYKSTLNKYESAT